MVQLGRHSALVRYLLNGTANALLGYGLFCAIYFLLRRHCNYLIILTITNVICVGIGHWSARIFVFRSRRAWLPESLRFYVIYGCCVLVNYAVMYLGVGVFGFQPVRVQIVATAASAVFGFVAHRSFTFRELLDRGEMDSPS